MATMVMSFVPTDSLKADLYGSSSEAYRAREWVAEGHHHLRAWFAFGRLNRILDDLFNGLYRLIEDTQRGVFPPPPEDASPVNIEDIKKHLWRLHNTLDSICELSIRKGFRKKALLKSPLLALEAHREQILDIIQWADESSDQQRMEHLEQSFSTALEEFRAGETITVG